MRTLDAAGAKQVADPTPAQTEKLRRIEEICSRAAALPRFDNRTPDEIIGYDDKRLW